MTDEEIARIAEGQKLAPSKEYQQIEVQNILEALNQIRGMGQHAGTVGQLAQE